MKNRKIKFVKDSKNRCFRGEFYYFFTTFLLLFWWSILRVRSNLISMYVIKRTLLRQKFIRVFLSATNQCILLFHKHDMFWYTKIPIRYLVVGGAAAPPGVPYHSPPLEISQNRRRKFWGILYLFRTPPPCFGAVENKGGVVTITTDGYSKGASRNYVIQYLMVLTPHH